MTSAANMLRKNSDELNKNDINNIPIGFNELEQQHQMDPSSLIHNQNTPIIHHHLQNTNNNNTSQFAFVGHRKRRYRRKNPFVECIIEFLRFF